MKIDDPIEALVNSFKLSRGKWYKVEFFVKPKQRTKDILVDDLRVVKHKRIEQL